MILAEIEREYERSYKDLLRFTTLILRDEEKAKDVVQEVFASLITYQGEVKLETFHTWMLKRIMWYIKRHVWVHKRTEQEISQRTIYTEDLENTKEEGSMPDYDTDPSVERALQQALAKLSPREHDTVVMRLFEGLSFGEIARRQKITKQAVQPRYRRAVRKLRLALESVGIEGPSFFDSTEPSTTDTAA